jgi:23S rRNA-/tRNA-specific pseudouridylate synthase
LNDQKYSFNHSIILKQKEMMLFALGLRFNHPITNSFINISI